ncbi:MULTISPECIES: N-acetylglucosamine-6-phosphate deacetylase [unclassified Rothia (in: high G+C Gram-positive bacteria)]|uniref:N-acetylglucosamine-6-phosphate deacetylase n=1 Tax=unclassified Rothia (in: high G+C Gram-positive bacteria) TaxID=2689056 RepID=UPI00195BD7E4|nr:MULTISPECIES: N-acetylglucosamine-6-phosphate deacetylase [unclassified Rothia (in: high G+C Gram-positive bacteria)]MBM7052073.1 N-acetylglucosamine-6-phosphate deacetylase [Rothia sp. ZJ1223]QRZ61876.1 N-acetylglucosamine-6-phosphate deacetylase [Rothia sp. ZJ932]
MSEQLYSNVVMHSAGSDVARGWVHLRDGSEVARGEGDVPQIADVATLDGSDLTLAPRFTDIHNHGGGGISFEDAPAIGAALDVHVAAGTGQLVASLVTNPVQDIAVTVGALREVIERQKSHERQLVGIHLEGPYLSPAHKGAHNPHFLVSPTPAQAAQLIEAGGGYLKQITIAPETDSDLAAIRYFVEHGVAVAVGHTDADYALAKAAFEAGASILTHTFNAMRPLLHREPGPVAAALDSEHVTLELICDGVHVHAPTMRALWAMAPGRVALVTDAMAAAGCQDGHYMLGSLDVDVVDSVARLSEGGAIAGSTLTLARAVETAVSVGISLPEAIEAAATVPARALGFDQPAGGNLLDRQGKLVATFAD